MLRLRAYIPFVLTLLCTGLAAQIRTPKAGGHSSLIKFTENKNQWEAPVAYRAQLDGGALWVEKNALTYSFYDKETYRSLHANYRARPTKTIRTTGFKVHFTNANPYASIESSEPTPDYNNYFIGKDPSKWAGNVKNYQRLLYSDLWNGINLEALGQQNSVKYNFYVKPGADPAQIKMFYDKVEKITLHKGELLIKTSLHEIVEHEPYAYQLIDGQKVEVPCKFHLKNNTVSFVLPKGYDSRYELVIDPVLVFACSSGSTADNFGMTATYDTLGNLYSGGTCFDQGFPVVNAYDATYNGVVQYGMTDVVITKYDSSGTFLQYSTYVGGAVSSEIVTSLVVDKQNNLYLYGATGSSDFPITAGAYDNTYNGGDTMLFMFNGTFFYYGTDIYVAKLSAAGNTLLASTFIGGSDNDGVNTNNVIAPYFATLYNLWVTGEYPPDSLQYNYGDQYRGEIQLDQNDNPIICSSSRSANFPTANAFDNTLGGQQDAVVVKFNQTLSSLTFSTFLGGSNNDAGYALFVAANNEVYATGGTRSSDFPATAGAYKTAYQGGKADGYIARISPGGNTLMAATYIGTPSYDQSYFIQLDKNQNAYVFGQSMGSMPVQNVGYSNTNGKQFVCKLDSNLATLIFSTVIGNGTTQLSLSPAAFLVDCSENIYMCGWGGNIVFGPATFNMPLTSGAVQSSNPDGFNFYLMVLSKNAQGLLHGTYFGGPQSREHVDGGTSRFDRKGIIYQSVCAGCGGNDDFPVTPGSWPTSLYGNNWNQSSNCNNGTFKIKFEFNYPQANITSLTSGCAPLTLTFTNTSISYDDYIWDFGNNDTTSLILNPVKTYTAAGTYTVNLYVKNNSCFNGYDTATTIITVFPKPAAAFSFNYDSCANSGTFLNASTIGSGSMTYSWTLGNGQTSTAQQPGSYSYPAGSYTPTLIVTSNNGCKDTVQQPLNFTLQPYSSAPDTILCDGNSIQMSASGGLSYTWSPAGSLNNPNSANPVATPTASTVYTVAIGQQDALGNACVFYLVDSITLLPSVTAGFGWVKNNCGNTLSFSDSSFANVTSWWWSYGDGSVDSVQNPTHSYGSPGTYTVTLAANNQYGCPDTVQQVITLAGFSPVSVSASQVLCKGDSVQLNASGGISYQWSPASSLSNANISNPVASPTATTQYTVVVTQVNGSDTCASTLFTNITVPVYSSSVLTATATPDTIYVGQSSTLGTGTSGGTLTWSPNYNINNVNSANPIVTPGHTTTYTVSWTDGNGCSFPVANVTIYVITKICDDGTVFVPNTFTPNGDGVNDIMFARSNLLLEVDFNIYDRWGQLVFHTDDIKKGWDGIFNGKPCNPDVFGYYIKFKCNNGKESFKKGNITLIR
jgi:gliding motility-associated-like protein